MSADDDFHRFLKRWAKKFFSQDDAPWYSNLGRRDEYGDWSKRFLDHYDKAESGKGTEEDGTVSLIEKVTSDFMSYLDKVEESKKSKKER